LRPHSPSLVLPADTSCRGARKNSHLAPCAPQILQWTLVWVDQPASQAPGAVGFCLGAQSMWPQVLSEGAGTWVYAAGRGTGVSFFQQRLCTQQPMSQTHGPIPVVAGGGFSLFFKLFLCLFICIYTVWATSPRCPPRGRGFSCWEGLVLLQATNAGAEAQTFARGHTQMA
jgi:hypothetical protein